VVFAAVWKEKDSAVEANQGTEWAPTVSNFAKQCECVPFTVAAQEKRVHCARFLLSSRVTRATRSARTANGISRRSP
jgi:hypothetical protein